MRKPAGQASGGTVRLGVGSEELTREDAHEAEHGEHVTARVVAHLPQAAPGSLCAETTCDECARASQAAAPLSARSTPPKTCRVASRKIDRPALDAPRHAYGGRADLRVSLTEPAVEEVKVRLGYAPHVVHNQREAQQQAQVRQRLRRVRARVSDGAAVPSRGMEPLRTWTTR